LTSTVAIPLVQAADIYLCDPSRYQICRSLPIGSNKFLNCLRKCIWNLQASGATPRRSLVQPFSGSGTVLKFGSRDLIFLLALCPCSTRLTKTGRCTRREGGKVSARWPALSSQLSISDGVLELSFDYLAFYRFFLDLPSHHSQSSASPIPRVL
jgi:hypothetical protein